MKTKIRFIGLNALDSQNLEGLLNLYAREGWHFKTVIWKFLVFEYDPSRQRGYTVLIDYGRFRSKKKQAYRNELASHINYLETFDYHGVGRTRFFEILDRPQDVTHITDRELEHESNHDKRVMIFQSTMQDLLSMVLCWIIWFYGHALNSLIQPMIQSNAGLIIFVLFILILVYGIIKYVRVGYFAYKHIKQSEYTTPSNFTITHHTLNDALGLYFLLMLMAGVFSTIMLIMFNFSNAWIVFILSLIALFVSGVLLVVMVKNDAKVGEKIIFYLIPSIACIGLSVYGLLTTFQQSSRIHESSTQPIELRSTGLQLHALDEILETNTTCRVTRRESIVVEYIGVECDTMRVEIYASKQQRLNALVTFATTNHFYIENQTTSQGMFANEFVHRINNIFILGDISTYDSLTELINEITNAHTSQR